MKTIDYTQQGGLPDTQEFRAYTQTAYTEIINALASSYLQSGAAAMTPVLLSGMVISGSNISNGWFFYNGEIIKFNGGNVPTPVGGAELCVNIATSQSGLSLPYFNGSAPNILSEKTGTIGAWTAGTAPSATQFSFKALQAPGLGIGVNAKEASVSPLALASFSNSGTLYYSKNLATSNLQIYGTVSVVVSSLTASPNPYYAMGQLPAGYRPNSVAPFTMFYRYHQSNILDDTSKDYIRQINAEIGTDGTVSVGLIKAAANYTLYWNTIIPLD